MTKLAQAPPPLRVLTLIDKQQGGAELTAFLTSNGCLMQEEESLGYQIPRFGDLKVDAVLIADFCGDDQRTKIFVNACEQSGVAIVVVSGNTDPRQKVAALEAGALDYISKPFYAPEILVRVRMAVKHKRLSSNIREKICTRSYRFAGYEYDGDKQELVKPDGAVQGLTVAQGKILVVFLESAGRILSRSDILAILGDAADPLGRAADSHVRRLRKKMEVGGRAHVISTFYGGGYMIGEHVVKS